jgi:hypothetical protein
MRRVQQKSAPQMHTIVDNHVYIHLFPAIIMLFHLSCDLAKPRTIGLFLKEEGLHAPRLHHSREAISSKLEVTHQANVVRVIRKIRTSLRQMPQSRQIDFDTLSEMRRVDHRHSDCAIFVHKRRYINVLGVAAGVYAYGTGASEAEVACESPQAGGDLVGVAVEADQSVVAGCVLCAPPVRVAGG